MLKNSRASIFNALSLNEFIKYIICQGVNPSILFLRIGLNTHQIVHHIKFLISLNHVFK
jgi:hypothetical protein